MEMRMTGVVRDGVPIERFPHAMSSGNSRKRMSD
jgi:hypothetical protein